MSFDLDAVREWGNWEDGPVEFTPSQRRLWRQVVSDVLAACDEIERLERLLEQKDNTQIAAHTQTSNGGCEHPGWDGSSLFYCKECGYHVQLYSFKASV